MREISFTKMVASGNDFVVVDNRNNDIPDALEFAKTVCRPHVSVGADGILLLEDSAKADFKMRIVNSDGSEAEACGNGFRCIALYAANRIGFAPKMRFESLAGLIEAEVDGKEIRVQLSQPSQYRQGELEVAGHRLHYSFINTGVPHVVIIVEGLKKVDVFNLGRAIRQHPDFKPKGTNVNFIELVSRKEIEVRTYERGVEDETLACGTGSTASAIVSALHGYTKPPVKVRTRSGEILTIDFDLGKKTVKNVTLQGSASFVYEGKIRLQ